MAKAKRTCDVTKVAKDVFKEDIRRLKQEVASLKKRIAKLEKKPIVYEVTKDERALPNS